MKALFSADQDMWNRIGLALLVVVVAAFVLTGAPRPSARSVDGTYDNPCCSPIRLDSGVLVAGEARVPFRLANMKFGLVAEPSQSLKVGPGNAIQIRQDQEPASIPFDEDRKGFTLPGEQNAVYDFRLQ